MRIRLLSEGNTDVMLDYGDARQGALKHIVRKVLADLVGRDVAEHEVEGDRLSRLHSVSGYKRKVALAIAMADGECDGVIIVIDRDGPNNSRRLRYLEEGREEAENQGRPLADRTVVGVMVEMLEAWLIADTHAVRSVCPIEGAFRDPESYTDPKRELNKLLVEHDFDVPTAYDAIASAIDLQVLRDRCPAFDALFTEMRDRLDQLLH